MKVDTNTPPVALMKEPNKVVKQTSQVTVDEAKGSQNSAKNSNLIRDKMLRWFSRAGVVASSLSTIEQDISKRISRHQYVKSQRKLKNLERILELAMSFSLEQGAAEDLDPDWFFSFIDMAENIHSPAMQELWGKIYAVEIGTPGSFSLKTLKTLKNLTHKDAKLLKTAVSLASRRKGEHGLKIMVGYHIKPSLLSLLRLPQLHQVNIAAYGLAYPDLLALMDLGLIYSSEIESSELDTSSRVEYRIGTDVYYLAPKKRGLSLTYYKLTSTGVELARLINSRVKERYLEELLTVFKPDFDTN